MESVKTPKRNGLFLCIIPFFLGKCRKTKVGQIERKSRNVKKRKQAAVLGCGGLFWKKAADILGKGLSLSVSGQGQEVLGRELHP